MKTITLLNLKREYILELEYGAIRDRKNYKTYKGAIKAGRRFIKENSYKYPFISFDIYEAILSIDGTKQRIFRIHTEHI